MPVSAARNLIGGLVSDRSGFVALFTESGCTSGADVLGLALMAYPYFVANDVALSRSAPRDRRALSVRE